MKKTHQVVTKSGDRKSENFWQKYWPYVVTGILAVAGGATCFAVLAHQSSDSTSSEDDIDSSLTDQGINLDLSIQTEDLILSEPGTYRLYGSMNHSVIVNAPDAEIELILDNVEIHSPDKAALVGLAAENLQITLADDTINKLSDGGASDYDGCIYSEIELVFDGTGTLTVDGSQTEGEGIATEAQNMTFRNGTYIVTSADDGLNAGGDGATITIDGGNFFIDAGGDGIDSNQNAVINGGTIFVMGSDVGGDAGIDTDDGFELNGGTVVALGSDMVEAPQSSSRQNSLVLTLDSVVAANTPVAILRDGIEVISFSASKSFRTLVVSSPELTEGTYEIYTGGSHSGSLTLGFYEGGVYTAGEKLSADGTTSFTVEPGVNQYGKSSGPGGAGGHDFPGGNPPGGAPTKQPR